MCLCFFFNIMICSSMPLGDLLKCVLNNPFLFITIHVCINLYNFRLFLFCSVPLFWPFLAVQFLGMLKHSGMGLFLAMAAYRCCAPNIYGKCGVAVLPQEMVLQFNPYLSFVRDFFDQIFLACLFYISPFFS